MKKLVKGLAVVTGIVGAAAVAVGVYEKLTGKNIVNEAKKYLDSLENDDSDYDFEEFGDWDEDDYDDYEGDDYDDSEDEEKEDESSENEDKKESEDDSMFVADDEDDYDEE